MNDANWLKIKEVFNQTLDLPESERHEFLSSFDESIRTEVLELLKSHYEAEGFIAEPAVIEFGLNEDQMIGKQIDDYRIVKEIGSGGMGKVYLATREGFEQKFALKLIKRGMDTEVVLKRFVRERQILSRLEHPNIARLLNAGSTKEGLPYFVMEFVEGLPVTKFCDSHQLDTIERLEIFQKVCEAVKYAHQNLVVHRDIKPSNILVTADGTPKLLDFGIAKLLNTDDSENTATATQARIFTPEYASPEQLNGLPITTSTDVYSLGVVLYELLSGIRPYNSTGKSYQEIANLVLTQEPLRPSSVVSRPSPIDKQATFENKELRTKDEGRRTKSLKGDLDNIILKALRKEPERRYQSVQEFSEDIRRYLVGLPVTATADTTFYRFSKFIGRNKIGTAIAVVVLLLSGFSIWQAVVANRERAKAEKRFNEVRKLANSVLFDYESGIQKLPGSTAVRERMVKDALEYLDNLSAESNNDSSLQSELAAAFKKVGDIQGNPLYANLGDMKGAQISYQKAFSIRQNLVEKYPQDAGMQRDMANSYGSFADLSFFRGNGEEALENYKKALAIDEIVAQENPADNQNQFALASWYYRIGQAHRKKGDLTSALENFEKSLEINRKLCEAEPDNREFCRSLSTSYLKIGDVHSETDRFSEALKNHQKAVDILEPAIKDETDASIRRLYGFSLNRLALDKLDSGDYQGSIEVSLRSLAIQKQLVESDSKNEQYRLDFGQSNLTLGYALTETNEFDKAADYFKKAIAIFEDSINKNPDNKEPRQLLNAAYESLGDTLKKAGKVNEANEAYKKARK